MDRIALIDCFFGQLKNNNDDLLNHILKFCCKTILPIESYLFNRDLLNYLLSI